MKKRIEKDYLEDIVYESLEEGEYEKEYEYEYAIGNEELKERLN
jgi:hypothetical protein